MQITRSSIATRTGPRDWFTGGVYVDTITAQPRRRGCRPQAFSSRRAPGPPWHTHPVGQTIYVLELVGRCQRRGGPVEVIGPGDLGFGLDVREFGFNQLPHLRVERGFGHHGCEWRRPRITLPVTDSALSVWPPSMTSSCPVTLPAALEPK